MMADTNPSPIDFEQSLAELETVVEQMETGDLSLEEALEHFERGIELTRACQATLTMAEQKVEQLLERNAQAEPATFDLQNIPD